MLVALAAVIGCDRTPRGSQVQTGTGADQAAPLRESDAALHALSAKIEQALTGDDKQRFLEAEEAWLAYRDADCDAEKALYEGDAAEPSVEAACLAKLTNERRAELQRIYRARVDTD